MKKHYAKLLEHPKWHEKRKELYKKKGLKCEICGAEDTELHIHHTYYEKDRLPWNYPDDCLWILCDSCHRIEHGLPSLYEEYELEKVKIAKLGLSPEAYDVAIRLLCKKLGT